MYELKEHQIDQVSGGGAVVPVAIGIIFEVLIYAVHDAAVNNGENLENIITYFNGLGASAASNLQGLYMAVGQTPPSGFSMSY